MTLRKVLIRVLLTLAGLMGTAMGVAFLVALFGPIAERATPPDKDRAAAVNSTRQILLATTAGTAALIGLGFTARTYFLGRRGQFTDRYTKAIDQLASDKLTERLGGIYALEHLMRESARDHETVVEVLAAFVRESAPARALKTDDVPQRPSTDVQAALIVLGRRPRRMESDGIDLARTDLRRASLVGVQLKSANLTDAQLQHANLGGAQLQDANLSGAQLQDADLSGAQLQDADLSGAQLQGACLVGAQLRGAYLIRAQLHDANLARAQLQGTILVEAHLQEADLADARLQGANLVGAKLQGAVLSGAELRGADFRHARFCDPDGTRPARGLQPEQLKTASGIDKATLPGEF